MDHLQLITGNANGRPPDASLPVVSHPRLERQATSACVEDHQSVKRCRGDGLETMDVHVGDSAGLPAMVTEVIGDECMFGESNTDQGSGENHYSPVKAAQGVKPSFRDMLAGKGARNASASNFRSSHPSEGMSGKFDILNTIDAEDEDNGTVEPVVGQGVSVPTSLVEEGATVGDKISGSKGSQEGGRTVMVEDGIDSRNSTRVILNGSGSKPSGGVSRTQKLDGLKAIVANEIIVPSKVSLNSNNHVAVRVVERGSDILSEEVTGRKAATAVNAASIKSGQPLSFGKNVVRKGATFKHKQQHRVPTQVALGDWIGNLSREISSGIVQDDNQDSDPRDGRVRSESDVHWKVNTAFDPGLPQ
ncbi:hypothetical protein V6N12_076398 [Hibiscus sabdariffa]|uniref:Uncharacterized protein n=1 Tax=Hibiscus sabdariffa TaxID=183260 RepID=A0ABR2DA19_9ROSI